MAATDMPLDLVVRFSTSNPDIVLSIPNASATTTLSLKQRLRSHLEAPAASSRLRLIHAGKVLPDATALARSLNVTLPPPTRNDDEGRKRSEKAKGKLPVREEEAVAAITRVYIHCSVGDSLSPAELAKEAQAAEEADAALQSDQAPTTSQQQQDDASTKATTTTTTTTPAPRGFDRLLTAGFTPAEVAALRTQFLAIQAHTHTPDTMPSGPDLLALEERWLDNTHSPSTGGGGDDTGGFGSEDAGGLEDMLYGNLVGFFWPVGAVFWLMREEGVWSRRRKIAVLSGFLVNLTFGFLRVMN